ncbi:PREDICTED: NADH dehydrogenase [ubiquinone] iron-sulfur protein 6, mitochondrial [Nipponia nippon]|uniref:NADH dehydrogenase [ubiquinone] iron-sulfur protein 6, mitochondrial n=1 Tax=Nipponia nippon TaxID=128390 RepID=UPI000510DA6D|nr:PREDICTED: NADH dehydrogenase [ubiquinone] iron-sulfur protein 6, mitochondrial [Nipponia nippon]
MRIINSNLRIKAFKISNCLDYVAGKVYEEKDYRRVRFVGRQKEVNKNFAIDLIAEQPVSEVESRVISCDGGGGALGHPKVYINLDKDTKTGTCGYCGLQFKQKHH